jgi:8-oxo-dGTP pyrophosphatase MutT (NUDIX family)
VRDAVPSAARLGSLIRELGRSRPPVSTAAVAHGAELIPAAVLVPIILADPPSVLLTKRKPDLARHAGQVSFPGGRIEPDDGSAEAAAVREAAEEIGLDPGSVELAARLPDVATGTGFRITPVIGLLPPGLTFHPSPFEVEVVFELPIAVLFDPTAPRREHAELRGERREIWVWPHADHRIWGATARILLELAQRLRGN